MQREAAIVAAEAGLYVEFSERSLNDIMQARRVELIADRATAVETRAQDRPRFRATPPLPTPGTPTSVVRPVSSPAPISEADPQLPDPSAPAI
jgi:hypothetical protein